LTKCGVNIPLEYGGDIAFIAEFILAAVVTDASETEVSGGREA
jgi:hypothetical protein